MERITKETINVGVLGVGFGITHVRALAGGLGSLRLKTVCDMNTERLEKVKTELSSKSDVIFSQNYLDLLNDPEIDVVSLSLPHHLHQRFVEEAAAAGKQIMLDKPLARTEEEGRAIAEAVKKAGIQFMVAFNFRFHPLYQAMQKKIAAGAIGKVQLALTRHDQRFYYPNGSNWKNSQSVGGGAIIGSGVHNLDFMRFCLGDPEEVYACGITDLKRLDAEAGATVVFRYANGTIVNFFCNWCKSSRILSPSSSQKYGEWEFYGEDGEIRMTPEDGLFIGKLDDSVTKVSLDNEKGQFTNLWLHFEDCLRTGKTPLTNIDEAMKTQRLIAVVYESMKTGKPVRLDNK